jgi:hypothetical protein
LRRAKSREKRREVICGVKSLRHFDPAGCVYSHATAAAAETPDQSLRDLERTAVQTGIIAQGKFPNGEIDGHW